MKHLLRGLFIAVLIICCNFQSVFAQPMQQMPVDKNVRIGKLDNGLTYYIRANPGREMMKSLAQGSTRYNLSKTALREASVLLPLKDEQVAIADVLSEMDAELLSLETHRDKTRNIKQAMMQELLTGKTRLV